MALDVNIFLFAVAGIIAIGFVADLFFAKTKIPDMLWLMLIGVILGPAAAYFGYPTISRGVLFSIAPVFSAIALMIILFESGLYIDLFKLLRASLKATQVMLTNVVFSIAVVAILAKIILNLGTIESILLGAILSGTSSAIVTSTINRTKVSDKTKVILNLESIVTDPLVIIIALVLIDAIVKSAQVASIGFITSSVLKIFAASLLIGIMGGFFWSNILPKIQKYKYHHMLTLAYLFVMYIIGETIGGSGAIVAFSVGLMLGNTHHIMKMFQLKKKIIGLTKETKDFNAYITFFIRTFFYVFLGLLISFERPMMFLFGILLSIALLYARKYGIKLTVKDGFSPKEKALMTYLYPRGLAAAIMSTLPFVQYGIAAAQPFVDIGFAVILSTAVISTIGIARTERTLDKRMRYEILEPNQISEKY